MFYNGSRVNDTEDKVLASTDHVIIYVCPALPYYCVAFGDDIMMRVKADTSNNTAMMTLTVYLSNQYGNSSNVNVTGLLGEKYRSLKSK